MTTQRARTVGHMEPAGKRREIAGPKPGFTQSGAPDSDWRKWAACRADRLRARKLSPSIFFPTSVVAASDIADAERARAICVEECPVRAQCLRFADASGCSDGIFGGLDGDERRAAKRKALRARAKSAGEDA